MIRAVIFELDDVLFDADEYARAALKPLAEGLARRFSRDRGFYFAKMLEAWQRSSRRDLTFLDSFVHEAGLPAAEAAVLAGKFVQAEAALPLHADASRFIARFEGELGLAIVTDGVGLLQRAKVRATDLVTRMPVIVFSSDWGSVWQRPSPLPLLVALRLLQVNAREAVFVGCDPELDAPGPQRLHMPAVRLRRGPLAAVPDRASSFSAAIDSLDALADLDLFRERRSA
ncbi:MAG: HAD family hydrolase [Planctomycetes bacterium]|nr:HAD family hydrolase [Planctomycetota bacterium]